jgi:hypothetical protein
MNTPATGSRSAPERIPAVRCGVVPALAGGFVARPDSVPGLAALVPGGTVALVPAAGPGGPAGSCGKTGARRVRGGRGEVPAPPAAQRVRRRDRLGVLIREYELPAA